MNTSELYKLAIRKYNNGEYSESVALFYKSLAVHKDWQSYQGLGLALINVQKYQSAVDAFKLSLDLEEHWHSYQGLGLALFNMQRHQSAVDAFKRSLALKEDWQSYQGLGSALYNMQNYQQSVNAYKQSLALKDHWQSRQRLGWALFNMQNYKAAADAFQQSLALKEHWLSYQGLGRALYNIDQRQQSVDAFKHSLALKEHWQSYQGLGLALLRMQQYQQVINAFKQSLALKEHWQSYLGLGLALNKIQQYQQAVTAFKKSLALKEDVQSYQGLGWALDRLGKVDEGIKAMRVHYKQISPHLKLDPFLGKKHKVSVSRDMIENIIDNLSKIQCRFHPSYFSESEEENQCRSWENLIHIHIPKCAGTNFEKPLTELASFLKQNQNNKANEKTTCNESKYKHYFWHGNLWGKCNHDALMLEAFQEGKMNNIQGSFVSNQSAKYSIYSQKISELGLHSRKVCLVRDPSQRLYSHIRHLERTSYTKTELFNECIKECSNLMDRYIYDYNLFEGHEEAPYCNPDDYENCKSIEFVDISDDDLISKIKSSFLSASLMPNIVQFNRLNDHRNKRMQSTVGEKAVKEVYRELTLRGFQERDNLIDLQYLKNRTNERLVFPNIIQTGVELHPITFIYMGQGSAKLILTKDFVTDPLNAINL